MKKIAIFCYDLNNNNKNRQPWRFAWELFNYLSNIGVKVTIYSNKNDLKIISRDKPDLLLIIQGLTNFLNPLYILYLKKLKRAGIPIIGIITSPIYKLSNFFKLGIKEFVKNWAYLNRLFLSSLIPPFFFSYFINKINDFTVTLSYQNYTMLKSFGVNPNKINVVLPGKPQKSILMTKPNKNNLSILYLGSPLSLRGPDLFIQSLAKLKNWNINFKGIMLLRIDELSLLKEVDNLKKQIFKLGLKDMINVIVGNLTASEIEKYYLDADIIVQPFKIVVSDMPVAVIEAMSYDVIPVVTKVDGLIDIVQNGNGVLVEPRPNDIAVALKELILDSHKRDIIKKKIKEYIDNFPTWENSLSNFYKYILELTNGRQK